ncbi:MAG: prepilin peptidase [Acidobacteriia bacterium]|nr:prepilin peptidase [Terriglobia bacterium]
MIPSLIALLFGLLIGSFLNVCIYRWPRDLSVVRPRSHCPACEKTIAWYDNIPLVSYALLGAKCRYCRARISLRYPVVELLTGLLFFYFVRALGATPAAAKMCVFSALLVGLVFSDLEELILPDELTLGGVVLGILFAIFVRVPESLPSFALIVLTHAELTGRAQWLTEAVFGAALPAFFLWLGGWIYERVRHREGLGLGDVKLIAMVGSFLGLSGALFTLMLGSIAGSVIGYGYIRATGKDASNYELPFGTFLGAAALVIALLARTLLGS